MTIVRSTAFRSLRATTHLITLNGGRLEVWSGAMPADLGTPAGTKLVDAQLANPCGTVSEGVFELAPFDVMAVADGVAGFVRLKDGAGNPVMDLSAGGVGSGAAVIISPVTIYAGGNLRVIRLKLTEP